MWRRSARNWWIVTGTQDIIVVGSRSSCRERSSSFRFQQFQASYFRSARLCPSFYYAIVVCHRVKIWSWILPGWSCFLLDFSRLSFWRRLYSPLLSFTSRSSVELRSQSHKSFVPSTKRREAHPRNTFYLYVYLCVLTKMASMQRRKMHQLPPRTLWDEVWSKTTNKNENRELMRRVLSAVLEERRRKGCSSSESLLLVSRCPLCCDMWVASSDIFRCEVLPTLLYKWINCWCIQGWLMWVGGTRKWRKNPIVHLYVYVKCETSHK
jgi:hypothetical protein